LLGSDRKKKKQNKKEMLRITDLRQTKDGRYITAPNSKWPVVVRWEKFPIFDMQFSRRLLKYGPSSVSCESLWLSFKEASA